MKRTIAPLLLGLIAGLFCMSVPAFAQNKTVSGKVTDSQSGAGVAGVSVTVKGTNTGTQTSADGAYTVSVAGNGTLVFTAVGFERQEVAVGDRSEVNVSMMAASANNLNEVVVVGYGTSRKRDLTGSVTSVKAKDFNQGIIPSPDQLIQGKVAGLQVVTNSGAPGAATTIRIRGNSSLRSGNNPLFVIDGIPLDGRLARPGFAPAGLGVTPESNPLYFFNSADIASMDVLKDASATAIYGSRAANGVIMITTKQGSTGAAKLDFSTSFGMSNVSNKFDILDAGGYRNALKTYNLTNGDFGGNADAMDEILQTGFTQNYNVGVSGGSENGKYRMSIGYLDQKGVLKKTSLQRFTVNANGQYKFLKSKRLSLDFNVFAGQAKENIAPITNDAGFRGNLIGMALQWNPTQNLYNADGSVNIIKGSSIINPVAMSEGYNDISNINSLLGTVGLGYAITDDFSYKFNVSLNKQTGVRQAEIKPYVSLTEIEDKGQGYQGNTQMSTLVLQHLLNYNKQLSTNFNLAATLGYEYQDFKWSGSSAAGIGFANGNVPLYNILQNIPAANRVTSSFEDPDASLQSYFGRVQLNFADRFLVTGTMRADGSSKFGENNKYGYFPSVAAAWNISNEGFIKDGAVFQNLKLRGSYGLTGNQAFPAGSAQTQWAYANNGGGIFQLNVANADLKWETTKQLNIGLDFAIAKGRIYGALDYFNRVTSDILFAYAAIQPAPAVTVWQNIPDATITNSGLEVSLGAAIVAKKDLTWNFSVNAAFLKNVFENYDGPPIYTGAISGQGLTGAFVQRIDNGQPLNAFYTRKFLGLDKDGLGTYANNEEPEFVGDPNPSMLLGLSTDLTWKKLSVVLNMNGAFGHDLYNNTLNAVLPIGNLGTRNIGSSLMSLDPKEALSNPIKASSRYLESGNFLRLANLSFSYNLGNLGKDIKNASVFLTGQNLLVFTNFTGFDPEVNTDKNIGGVPSFGIEYLPYPAARTIQAGFRFGL